MNEEEITERIKDLIHTCDFGIQQHGTYDDLFELDKTALEGILDLYNKEKEKNTELRIQISAREQVCEDLQEELEQEKEKNKELQKEIENWKFTAKYVEDNYIDKAKVRGKINKLNNSDFLEDVIAVPYLKELLEEK
jgi:predicted RNase H-like nuclease (RuvC/YqgF family)